ncbi:MC001R [Molluscum contagiosum virus]|uniref:MC001R n=1 Tax=Molluscum contagiosum virus TaxID=10279 RepID=A0A858A4P6_9POXV|nr:MC001R [Molluscum contagiosum virus]
MFFVRVRRDSRSQVPGRARLFGVAHARLLCLVRAGTMRRARTVVLCRVCGAPSTVWYRTVLLRVCGHQCWLLGTRCCFFACRHEQFFAGQPVVVPGHKTSRVRPSARVVVVQAQEVLGAGGAHRCFVLSRAQAAGTRCQGRAQVFCSFTRAGSRHQVPGARTGVLFFHARRQQAPGARGHEHGRVFVLLSRVQAAGPNTGVFCVFVFRAGSRTEHGRVLCFCFPCRQQDRTRACFVFLFSSRACMHLAASTSFRARTRLCPFARAGTWHEPGCVLSRVQAPGTNTVVFVFWVLFPPARADAPARTRLFRAGASRFVCVCGHEQSCFLFARLQTHVLVSACVRVCLSHEDNTSTTCSLCSVRADARHRASNHPERARVCVHQAASSRRRVRADTRARVLSCPRRRAARRTPRRTNNENRRKKQRARAARSQRALRAQHRHAVPEEHRQQPRRPRAAAATVS